MQINGEWFMCDDKIERPIIRGEVLAGDGSLINVIFLLDTGADRTVLSATDFSALHYTQEITEFTLAGVGGLMGSLLIDTKLVLTQDNGRKASFNGQFAVLASYESLDYSVLGRDITNLFAVIVDRPNDLVCLINQNHTYKIEAK